MPFLGWARFFLSDSRSSETPMEKTIVIIVICAAILWLMIRRPVVAVTRAANQVGGTAGSIGASAAGAGTLFGLGGLIGGALKGWTSNPAPTPTQPFAVAGSSTQGSAGLGGDLPATADDAVDWMLH